MSCNVLARSLRRRYLCFVGPSAALLSDDPATTNVVTDSLNRAHRFRLLLAFFNTLTMHMQFLSVFLVLLSGALAQSNSANSSASATSSAGIPQITGINASLPLCAIVLPPPPHIASLLRYRAYGVRPHADIF